MAVLCLLTNTPWPWPTPAGAASARGGVSPTLAEERKRNGKGGCRPVCTSESGSSAGAFPAGVVERGRLGKPLVARQGRSPSGACLPRTARQRHYLLLWYLGWALRSGKEAASLPLPPLRTGLDGFPSSGSSRV